MIKKIFFFLLDKFLKRYSQSWAILKSRCKSLPKSLKFFYIFDTMNFGLCAVSSLKSLHIVSADFVYVSYCGHINQGERDTVFSAVCS